MPTAAEPHIPPYPHDAPLLEATQQDGMPRMQIYCPDQAMVVLGRGSKAHQELHLQACLEQGVPLFRRRGGGCAVVLDPGNVIVSVVLPMQGIGNNNAHFRRLTNWLIHGLNALGIDGVKQDGISDLVLGDRKVGGACIHRPRNLLHYSASLLVTPETALMGRYLKHPPREPDYRRGRAHDLFVGRLTSAKKTLLAEKLEWGLHTHLRLEDLLRHSVE